MRNLSAGATKRDMERATRVLSEQALPRGIARFELEAAEDQDGDPVLWVWLDGEDTSRWSASRREDLSDYLEKAKQRLYDQLEDYRPHFRLRTIDTTSRLAQKR